MWPVVRWETDRQTDRQNDYWGHPFKFSGFFSSTYQQGSAQQAQSCSGPIPAHKLWVYSVSRAVFYHLMPKWMFIIFRNYNIGKMNPLTVKIKTSKCNKHNAELQRTNPGIKVPGEFSNRCHILPPNIWNDFFFISIVLVGKKYTQLI